ncbi:MAG: M12 family metallo-peptidase, partial [Acidobacteria bacterium]|nr:M12 family metallo-peptidase [Acidobacteriota bacterium]
MPLFDRAAVKRFAPGRQRSEAAAPVEMNFFPDVSLNVQWSGVRQTDDLKSFVWTGTVAGAPLGEAVLIVSDKMVTGDFSRGDGMVYELRTAADGTHWVREIDQRLLPKELPPRTDSPASAGAAPPAVAGQKDALDDGLTIDVMVVYTPAARQKAGGTEAMRQLIELAIAETNQGYRNSAILQQVRLAYSGEVDYSESGAFDTDLDRLASPDDGYMDDIHRLRNSYAADLVSLWVEAGDACGLGFLMTSPSRASADQGFSVVMRSCATGYYSFGHEMGHNMGASHARDDGTGPGAYPYAYGFKQRTGADLFRTVMAYDTNCNCPRVNYWSNPGVAYHGIFAGVDPNAADAADNALVLNNTRTTVANYRVSQGGSGGGGGEGGSGSGLPESDHPYANNTDKTWTYTLPQGAASLNVTFDSRTSVEPGYDFIYISDANGTPISGSPFTGASLSNRTISVPGATVKIRLTSDSSTVDYGFKVTSITGNGVAGGSSLPRLVVTAFTAPATGVIGSTISGTRATVQNQGGGAAGPFRLGYYYSRNSNVTTADVYSGYTCTFSNGLAAGASSSCSGEIGVPASLSPGTWYVAAIVDDRNQVQQSDRSGNVRVSDGGPLNLTGGTPAELITPAPGSVLTSASAVFRWTPGTGVSMYSLAIGTTLGGTDIYNQDQGTALSVTISGLPAGGQTLYIKLSSRIGSETRA